MYCYLFPILFRLRLLMMVNLLTLFTKICRKHLTNFRIKDINETNLKIRGYILTCTYISVSIRAIIYIASRLKKLSLCSFSERRIKNDLIWTKRKKLSKMNKKRLHLCRCLWCFAGQFWWPSAILLRWFGAGILKVDCYEEINVDILT